MFTVEDVRFMAFCKSASVILKRRGFHVLILALAREADVPLLYEDLERYWTSLDDVTGRHIAFVVATNKSAQGTHPSAQRASFLLHEAMQRYPVLLQRYRNERPTRSELSEGQSSQISMLRQYLNIQESAIPCFHLSLLDDDWNKTKIIRIEAERMYSVYAFCKFVAEKLQPSLNDLHATLLEMTRLINHEYDVERQLSKLLKSIQYCDRIDGLLNILERIRQDLQPEDGTIVQLIMAICSGDKQDATERATAYELFNRLKDARRIPKPVLSDLQRLIDTFFDNPLIRNSEALQSRGGEFRRQLSELRATIELVKEKGHTAWGTVERAFEELPSFNNDRFADETWDFFVSYPALDRHIAESVALALKKKGSVFLDQWCMRPGFDWSNVIPSAQSRSTKTIAVITRNTTGAHFQLAEIQRAINLMRTGAHRIIPVYVGTDAMTPFGLEQIQGLFVPDELSLTDALASI